jgi:hypothetical protein
MNTIQFLTRSVCAAVVLCGGVTTVAEETQLTFSPKGHDLDNNDNFSPDGQYLVYDSRETVGPSIDYCQTVEKVSLETGKEILLYRPEAIVGGDRPAPGVGAASYSPVVDAVAFIHGPPVSELDVRGPYGKPNRNGASVPGDGSGALTWLDYRDIATDRPTIPGAHRGGTHRHEYSADGERIGFTYDDFLLPQYDRTVGYMEKHPEAPAGSTHYFANLVPIVPRGTAEPGQIEKAWGDSWVGRDGAIRAFIGMVREEDGSYQQSLFTVSVPKSVDITTAGSGDADTFPTPPEGTHIRRVTHGWAEGIVRGTLDGTRIAYYGHDDKGVSQIFVVPVDGGDNHPDKAKQPRQATAFPNDVTEGLRWHPTDPIIFCLAENGVAAVWVGNDDDFGKQVWVVEPDNGPERHKLVVSQDGALVAYNKAVPTYDAAGNRIRNYAGEDFFQIFTALFAGLR